MSVCFNFLDLVGVGCYVFFVFKQKTAYELRISDWSSDVCASDLAPRIGGLPSIRREQPRRRLPVRAAKQPHAVPAPSLPPSEKIGRASCRERVCQYV